MMTLQQAFIAAYKFLCIYFDETKDDNMIDLLSCMNPFFWADGNSLDPATYQDWLNSAKKVTNEEVLDIKQSFQVLLKFLEFHRDEFNYAPEWLIAELVAKTHDDTRWVECVAEVTN